VPNPLKQHKAPGNDQVKRLWKLLEQESKAQPEARPMPLSQSPNGTPEA
jgi:hypothetical protein